MKYQMPLNKIIRPGVYSLIGILIVINIAAIWGTGQLKKLPQVKGSQTIQAVMADQLSSSPPPILSESFILIDSQTHYPIASLKPHQKIPFASIAKLMTAMVVLDQVPNLDQVVTISPDDINVIETTIGLIPGEQITVRNLLTGMLVKSGNDTAYALARVAGGNRDNFVALMNAKAISLGMNNTNFADPAGLDDSALSTAYDLSNLALAASKNKIITGLTGQPEITFSSVDGTITHQLTNSNRLVTDEMPLAGTYGLKTGYTPDAGHSLVTAAKRDQTELISVVLNTNADTVTASAEESYRLLDWGFHNYVQ